MREGEKRARRGAAFPCLKGHATVPLPFGRCTSSSFLKGSTSLQDNCRIPISSRPLRRTSRFQSHRSHFGSRGPLKREEKKRRGRRCSYVQGGIVYFDHFFMFGTTKQKKGCLGTMGTSSIHHVYVKSSPHGLPGFPVLGVAFVHGRMEAAAAACGGMGPCERKLQSWMANLR